MKNAGLSVLEMEALFMEGGQHRCQSFKHCHSPHNQPLYPNRVLGWEEDSSRGKGKVQFPALLTVKLHLDPKLLDIFP